MHILFRLLLFTFLLLISCGKQPRDIVQSLVGRKIIIPEKLLCQILESPFEYHFSNAEFKIITYVDLKSCAACNMKLAAWNHVIDEFKSLTGIDVNFLMIINSNDKEIFHLLKMSDFNHPVMIDTVGNQMGFKDIPEEVYYRTFLLDKFDQILAIGNPVMNPKIKNLYKNIISENSGKTSCENHILANQPIKNIGLINMGDTLTFEFPIINKDSISYNIKEIIPFSDNVRVRYNPSVLPPNCKDYIIVEFIADTAATTSSTHIDIFYKEIIKPERLTVYGYLN